MKEIGKIIRNQERVKFLRKKKLKINDLLFFKTGEFLWRNGNKYIGTYLLNMREGKGKCD